MISKGSVLVVDDEVNLCRIVVAKLAKNGYNAIAVHDGVEAIEKVRERRFNVVLLDLILPKKDGLTALSEIRTVQQQLPVIIMSACENSDAVEEAMKRGACAYIKKPFDLDKLVKMVDDTSENESLHAEPQPTDDSFLLVKDRPITLGVLNHNGKPITYDSRIEDKDERTLSVQVPRVGGALVDIPTETLLQVGLAADDAYYTFESRVLARRDNCQPLLVIIRPERMRRDQRRASPRRQVRVPAQYARIARTGHRVGHLQHGLALDISDGGMRLALDEALRPGQLVYVQVDSVDERTRVSGIAQILRCSESDDPGIPPYVVGLRFSQKGGRFGHIRPT